MILINVIRNSFYDSIRIIVNVAPKCQETDHEIYVFQEKHVVLKLPCNF